MNEPAIKARLCTCACHGRNRELHIGPCCSPTDPANLKPGTKCCVCANPYQTGEWIWVTNVRSKGQVYPILMHVNCPGCRFPGILELLSSGAGNDWLPRRRK